MCDCYFLWTAGHLFSFLVQVSRQPGVTDVFAFICTVSRPGLGPFISEAFFFIGAVRLLFTVHGIPFVFNCRVVVGILPSPSWHLCSGCYGWGGGCQTFFCPSCPKAVDGAQAVHSGRSARCTERWALHMLSHAAWLRPPAGPPFSCFVACCRSSCSEQRTPYLRDCYFLWTAGHCFPFFIRSLSNVLPRMLLPSFVS